jgi:hypothetical protein
MIYKFTSKASGDVVMLQEQGEQLLRLLGREPSSKGIIEPTAMAQALHALQAAMAGEAQGGERTRPEDDERQTVVGLKQRLWPMVELLRRAQAAGQPVIWGA